MSFQFLARLVVLMSMACAMCSVRAGVLADMTQVLMSNSTAATTLSTRDRVGIFGGSLEMRAPMQTFNLVSFDPPRLDAGCGGVDLYGGSFSFINSQQLVQIFRAVAANAVGLAFKAAIMAISPSLDKLITEFQALLQNMNNLAKNSCQLAHLVVNGAEQALGLAVNADGSIGSSQSNWFGDQMASLSGYLADANGYLRKQAQVNPKAGNTNIKAIVASGSSSVMGLVGIGNFDGSTDDSSNPNSLNNRLLISVMGYEINALPCQNQSSAGLPDTTSTTSNPNLGTVTCTGSPTITLHDIVEGGGTGSIRPDNPLTLYECVDPNGNGLTDPGAFDPQICTQMRRLAYNYPGVRGFVNLALFGNVDSLATVDPASIVGQFNSGQLVNLTGQQVQFIKQTGIPMLALMAKTSNPQIRVQIAQRLSEQVISCIAAGVGEAIYRGAIGSQNGGQNNLSADTKTNIESFRRDVITQREACLENRRVLDVAQQLTNASRLMAGSIK